MYYQHDTMQRLRVSVGPARGFRSRSSHAKRPQRDTSRIVELIRIARCVPVAGVEHRTSPIFCFTESITLWTRTGETFAMTEQNEDRRPLRERAILWCVVGIALLLLLARVAVQRRELSTAVASVRQLREQNRFALAERTQLLNKLAAVLRTEAVFEDTSFVLQGVNVVLDVSSTFRRDDIDVLYVLSTQCAACLVNLPTLAALAGQGVRVVAFSDDDAAGSLRSYAQQHRLQFPVIALASGRYFRAFRGGLTPTTVLFHKGTVMDLRVGPLNRTPLPAQLALRGRMAP